MPWNPAELRSAARARYRRPRGPQLARRSPAARDGRAHEIQRASPAALPHRPLHADPCLLPRTASERTPPPSCLYGLTNAGGGLVEQFLVGYGQVMSTFPSTRLAVAQLLSRCNIKMRADMQERVLRSCAGLYQQLLADGEWSVCAGAMQSFQHFVQFMPYPVESIQVPLYSSLYPLHLHHSSSSSSGAALLRV